jgi:glycosyltransferase involved in cell wall biosynthesis
VTADENTPNSDDFSGNDLQKSTVSVVIPLYNKGKYIERALKSVLAQTRPASEIIVVDDGSNDDGPERVLSFNHPKIVLIRQENKGPGIARNVGLSKASGRYISFLDADDEWMPFFLERGLSLLEDKSAKVTVIYTGRIRLPDGSTKIFDDADGVYEITPKSSLNDVRKIYRFRTSANFMIVRTEVARRLGGFFDRYKSLCGEDQYLTLKLIFNERIGIISAAHGIYHTESSDLSGRGRRSYRPEPFFIHADDLLLSCDRAKRSLFKRFLQDLLFDAMKMHASTGRAESALELFNSFNAKSPLGIKEQLRFKSLLFIAPVLPVVLKIYMILRYGSRSDRSCAADS